MGPRAQRSGARARNRNRIPLRWKYNLIMKNSMYIGSVSSLLPGYMNVCTNAPDTPVILRVDRMKGYQRHARDELIRASQSLPRNIAEGNGKRSRADRKRFFQIARGSALECAAILDELLIMKVLHEAEVQEGKKLLHRIVSMLTKMTL